jgi:hypothetical protein
MDILRRLDFGNEAGDDVDPEELVSYFVEQESFNKFLDRRKKLLVATARKGVGKSALLKWIGHKVSNRDPDALVIKIRGADLVRSNFKLTSTLAGPNDHIRDWMIRLCAVVNRQLALQLKLAFSDDQITLVETAEIDGYKSRNLVGCLVERLQSLLDKGRGITKISGTNEVELLKRAKDRDVWIIIDDLDATYQNTTAESLSLATFFSACRYLTQDMKGIFFRVSMRIDVWALLRRYDESLDKVEQYVSEILWYQRDFLKLLSLRIQASLQSGSIPLPRASAYASAEDVQEQLVKLAFVPTMEWADKMTDTYKVIYTLSYERPRWAVQLCKLAQLAALRRNQRLIAKDSIDEVWGAYGQQRISDIVAEHKHQSPQVEELLNGFRGCGRQLTRDELFSWINNRILNHIEVRIEGDLVRTSREIARFLYRLGFILARSENADGEYEHYRFDQMPDFLSARTDEDFSVKWEIHPCYREALDIKTLNKSHRQRFSRLRNRKGELAEEFDPNF